MPTVPGDMKQLQAMMGESPSPEQLLMTAADMHARGQLTDSPTFQTPGAALKLPFAGGGRGTRVPKSTGKRR